MTSELTPQGVQQAYGHVMDNAHARAFLYKLAELRPQYAPQNESEANELVALGLKLAQATGAVESRTKQAANDRSRFSGAVGDLDNLMGVNKQAADESLEAALGLAQDPNMYNAVVTLKLAEVAAAQAQAN